MAAFAQWLAALRIRRVVFMAAFFPLPFFGLVSSAIVAMNAQLRGGYHALTDCLLALALLVAMAAFAGLDLGLVVGAAAFSWFVMAGLGNIVVSTRSLTLAIQGAVMLALIALLGLELAIGDAVAFWSPVLEKAYTDLAAQGVDIQVDIASQAEITGAAIVAGTLIGTLLSLLLGTSWARAVNSELVAQPFAELRLGYVIGGLAALTGLAVVFGLPTAGALLVFGTAFVFQGIAVLAWWAGQLEWPGGWWIGLLVVAVLLPQIFVLVVMLLATVGFVDNWYGLRRFVF